MSLEKAPLVAPVLGLAAWTFVMQGWLYTYRLSDAQKYKIVPRAGITKEEFNKDIPRHRQWPADNFNHLHEQPTVFYAVALSTAVLGMEDRWSVGLAWSYVGLRVVHSLIQARTNEIMQRWQVFMISSVVLLGMTVKAGIACL